MARTKRNRLTKYEAMCVRAWLVDSRGNKAQMCPFGFSCRPCSELFSKVYLSSPDTMGFGHAYCCPCKLYSLKYITKRAKFFLAQTKKKGYYKKDKK